MPGRGYSQNGKPVQRANNMSKFLTTFTNNCTETTDPGTTLRFLEEGLLMKNFIHPNIMGLIGLAFDVKDNPVIILPLMPFGDLRSYLRKDTTVRDYDQTKSIIHSGKHD